MSSGNQNLQQALTQCHYDQNTKNYLYNEQMHILQTYQMTFKPVPAKLTSGNFTILEVCGTIPVLYKGSTYNIPVKLHYLPGYPSGPPVFIVNPSPDMMIRESRHVQKDGKANFSILNAWARNYNTIMIFEEAKRIFSVEMPVFKRPKDPMPNSSPASAGSIQGIQGDPRFTGGYPPTGSIYTSVNPIPNGYSSVQPVGVSPYPGQVYNNDANGPSRVQPGYQSVQARPVTSYPMAPSVYPSPAPGYSTVPQNPNSGYPIRPDSQLLDPAPPPATKPKDTTKIKKIYKSAIDSLASEISVLKTESQSLASNHSSISTSLNNFKSEVEFGQSKLELIKANIKNTEDWISSSSSTNIKELNYEDLIEFRNSEAKHFLELSSQERSLESTILVIVEGIQKSLIPAKESLLHLKQLYTDLFLLARLKEKTHKLSLSSN